MAKCRSFEYLKKRLIMGVVPIEVRSSKCIAFSDGILFINKKDQTIVFDNGKEKKIAQFQSRMKRGYSKFEGEIVGKTFKIKVSNPSYLRRKWVTDFSDGRVLTCEYPLQPDMPDWFKVGVCLESEPRWVEVSCDVIDGDFARVQCSLINSFIFDFLSTNNIA